MSTKFNNIPQFKCPVYDLDGNALNGGKIYTYRSLDGEAVAVYKTKNGIDVHTNPIVLDTFGKCDDIFTPARVPFDFVVKAANGDVVATYKNFTGIEEAPVNPEA